MGRKKLLYTIILSGLSFFVSYLVNFFLTRYVTDTVGVDAYGFVSLCKTIAGYVVIATTALNSYASRYITLEYHKKDYKKANIYFNSVLWSNALFSTVLLVFSLVFTIFIKELLHVPDHLTNDVKILFVFVVCNLILTLLSTAFQSSAYIDDKISVTAVFKTLSYFAEALTLLGLYYLFPPRVLYVGIGLIIATAVNTTGYLLISRKIKHKFIIDIKDFKLYAVKEIIVSGIWNSINMLGNTLNSGLDLLVSNSMLSSIAMGQASIVKSLVTVFGGLYQMVALPFQPTFLRLYAAKDSQGLIKELKTSVKISGMISNIGFAALTAYGLTFIKLWLPHQDYQLIYHLSVIAAATSIFEGAVYPLYYIYTLTVKNRVPCFITILGGIANVAGMYFLIKYTNMGIYAVFITTAIIMNIINGITNPIYMAHCLNIKWTAFYPCLLRHVLACICVTFTMIGLNKVFHPDTWMTLILFGVLSCVVGAFIHILVVFNIHELKSIINRFRKQSFL